jgi:hypothetical protein
VGYPHLVHEVAYRRVGEVNFVRWIVGLIVGFFKKLGADELRAEIKRREAEAMADIQQRREDIADDSDDDIEKRFRRWQKP